jgi:hypothetical protein
MLNLRPTITPWGSGRVKRGLAENPRGKSPAKRGFWGAAGEGFEPSLTDPELGFLRSCWLQGVRRIRLFTRFSAILERTFVHCILARTGRVAVHLRVSVVSVVRSGALLLTAPATSRAARWRVLSSAIHRRFIAVCFYEHRLETLERMNDIYPISTRGFFDIGNTLGSVRLSPGSPTNSRGWTFTLRYLPCSESWAPMMFD